MARVHKTEAEWRKQLTPEQYRILREGGTEAPYSGEWLQHDESGTYSCAACGAELFEGDVKFESSQPGLAGWPSFYDAKPGSIVLKNDESHGMQRIEVTCAACGSHLGHLFPDTSPTGKHYCINSACLAFRPKHS